MKTNKIKLSVPPDLKFTAAVENFVDVIVPHFNVQNRVDMSNKLRSILNEAFINVIRHSKENLDKNVEILFEIEKPKLIIDFPNQGRGIQVQGHFPPYPDELKNSSFTFLKTIDGEVVAHIEDNNTINLCFREYDMDEMSAEEMLKNVKNGGMGLSLIVKLMDRVRFIYKEGKGNRLEITKKIESRK